MNPQASTSALDFTQLVATGDAAGTWHCACGMCGGSHDATGPGGAGGSTPGDFARAPTDNAFAYVAQTSAQGSGGGIAPLMAGSKWSSVDGATGKTIVTYSFAAPACSVFSSPDATDFTKTLKAFSAADQQTTRQVLEKIAAVCNVQFVEVADNAAQCGQIRYAYSDQPTAMNFAGYAFYPSSTAIGGNVWLASAQAQSQWDFYRSDLVLHETLHAMGLKHPFSGGSVLASDQDIIPNTVMSYSPLAGSSGGSLSSYPGEPMNYDISALQYLYGASSLNSGDNVYDLASGSWQGGFHSLWDAGGQDTLDGHALGRGMALDLRPGTHSDIGSVVTAQATAPDGSLAKASYSSTFSVAPGAAIENAVGSAFADTIVGNELGNRITGGGGNDSIDGGGGIDTAAYAGVRGSFSVVKTGSGLAVQDRSGGEGSDTLTSVERLHFADGGVALDLDGNAGTVAELLGAVFGVASVANPALVGIGLTLMDGGMGKLDLAQKAVDVRLGGNASHLAVVELLYANVTGHAPTHDQAAPFVDMLDHGMSAGALALLAAEHPFNQNQIDLVGLAANGLAYA